MTSPAPNITATLQGASKTRENEIKEQGKHKRHRDSLKNEIKAARILNLEMLGADNWS